MTDLMHRTAQIDYGQLLGSTRVFSGCSITDLARVIALACPFHAAAGEIILRQGDAADGLYALLRGSAQTHMRLPAAGAIRLDDVIAPAVVGELSLLVSKPRTATIVAAEEVSGLFFSREAFQLLRHAFDPVALHVSRSLVDLVADRIRDRVHSLQALIETLEDPTTAGLFEMVGGVSRGSRVVSREEADLCLLPNLRRAMADERQSLLDTATTRAYPPKTIIDPLTYPGTVLISYAGSVVMSVRAPHHERCYAIDAVHPGRVFLHPDGCRDTTSALTYVTRGDAIVGEVSGSRFSEIIQQTSPRALKLFDLLLTSDVETLLSLERAVARAHENRALS